jgi:Uma2 family endonuclease
MAMPAVARRMTAEEFAEMPDSDLYELIDGELVEREMGVKSSEVGRRVNHFIDAVVIANDLGETMQSDGGLKCFQDVFPNDPGRVLYPDGCFFSRARFPDGLPDVSFMTEPPDMVLKVASPNEKAVKLDQKAEWYFRAGVQSVWIAFPGTRTIWVRHPDRQDSTFGPGDMVEDRRVLPGFAVPIDQLFPR